MRHLIIITLCFICLLFCCGDGDGGKGQVTLSTVGSDDKDFIVNDGDVFNAEVRMRVEGGMSAVMFELVYDETWEKALPSLIYMGYEPNKFFETMNLVKVSRTFNGTTMRSVEVMAYNNVNLVREGNYVILTLKFYASIPMLKPGEDRLLPLEFGNVKAFRDQTEIIAEKRDGLVTVRMDHQGGD